MTTSSSVTRTDKRNAKPKARRGRPTGTKQVAKTYEPTPEERAAVEAMLTRKKELPVAPRVRVFQQEGAVLSLGWEHNDRKTAEALIMGAVGTVYGGFFDGLLRQLVNASAKDGEINEGDLNFMLDVIKGIEPQDQVESMLAAQMAAVHMATMTSARRLARSETLEAQDSHERAFNKLARTFTAQVEALKRYRTGGEQRVVVKHVHVYHGGQAICGNVAHGSSGGAGGRVPNKSRGQAHAKALAYALSETLPCPHPEGESVPGAGRSGTETVPHARRR